MERFRNLIIREKVTKVPNQMEAVRVFNYPYQAIEEGKCFVSRHYRNRRLGEFLKELDLSEGHSSGIPTIQDELERNGSPRAEFFTDDDRRAMRIRIPIHPVFLVKADKKPIKADREKLILEYVSEHGSIGNSEARELLGLAESTVKRLLTDMAKREILKDDGERKSRRYYLR